MSTSLKLFLSVLIVKILILFVVLFLFGESRLLWGDSPLYIDLGKNIYSGNGFTSTLSDGTLVENLERTPLYPLLVGFFNTYMSSSFVVLAFLQAIAAAGIAALVYQLAIYVVPSFWAILAAIGISFEPLISVIHLLILPDMWLVFLVLLFSYFFVTFFEENEKVRKNSVLAGLFLGISVLTKPITIYLFIIPLLFLLFKKRFKEAGVFFLVFLLILTPWVVYNYARAGSFDITTNDSKNICSWGLVGVLSTAHRLDSSNWAEAWALPEFNDADRRCVSTGSALSIFIFEYPGAFTGTIALSSLSYFTNEGYTSLFEKPADEQIKVHHNYITPAVFTNADWKERVSAALQEFSWFELAAVFAGKLFWIAILILAALGAMFLIRDRKKRLYGLFFLFIIAYFAGATIMTTAYGVSARLRYPTTPFLIILAMHALWWFYKRIWMKLRTHTESPTTQNAGS